MNNKQQKNIIYGYNNIESLPYQGSNLDKDEVVKNSTNINNAFQQLLDNDLFIENELNRIENSVIGPKADDSLSTLKNAPNGYKFWGGIKDQADLSVLHKIEGEIKDSITRIKVEHVKFICEYGNTVFISFENGELQYTDDGETYNLISNIRANGYYKDDNTVMFATDYGVYALDIQRTGFEEKTYSLIKINKNPITNASTVELDERGHRILVGANGFMYIGETPNNYQLGDIEENIVFYEKMMYDTKGIKTTSKVNDIQIVDEETQEILATENGMFKPSYNLGFIHKKVISSGNACKCTFKFNGNLYFGMSDGLYKSQGEQLVKIFSTDQQITSFSEVNQRVYFSTVNKIYYFEKQEIVKQFSETREKIKKIQSILFKEHIMLFVLTENGLKYVNSIQPNHFYNFDKMESVQDFIVKTGSRNYIFVKKDKELCVIELDNIQTTTTDIFNSIEEIKNYNPFISENYPFDSDSNQFIGFIETETTQIVVTKEYIVDANNGNNRYQVPSDYGEILTYQKLNHDLYKYLVVCRNRAFLLGQNLNKIEDMGPGDGRRFLGGHCSTDSMYMVTGDYSSETSNKLISYTFPDVIKKIDDNEFYNGREIKHIVEDGNSIYFVIDKTLVHTKKQNSFDQIKKDQSTYLFDYNTINRTGIDYPMIMWQHAAASVDLRIITDVKKKVDDDGDTSYSILSSDYMILDHTGKNVNGFFSDNNMIYSMTNNGVVENYIWYDEENEKHQIDTTRTSSYFEGKDIRSGTNVYVENEYKTETTKLFTDSDKKVYAKYQTLSSSVLFNPNASTKAILKINPTTDEPGYFIYSNDSQVHIKQEKEDGTYEHKNSYNIQGVRKILGNEIGILLQNSNGLSVLSSDEKIHEYLTEDDIVDILYYKGITEDEDSEESEKYDDYIIATKEKLIKFTYDSKDKKHKATELYNFKTKEDKEISSISRYNESNYIVNHGNSYTICEIDGTTVKKTPHSYPHGINGVEFFSHHDTYNIVKTSDGKTKISSYMDESGSDITELDDVVKGYYNGDDRFIYSTEHSIKNGNGTLIYKTENASDSIKDVFYQMKIETNGTQTIEYFYQNRATSLDKLRYVQTAKQLKGVSGIEKVAFQDEILFYLDGNKLYCNKLSSENQIFQENSAFKKDENHKILEANGIKDIVFSNLNSNGNRFLYVMTDKILYKWEYRILKDPTNQLDEIKKKTNFIQIDLGDIKENTKKFKDLKIQFMISGTIEDITSAITNTKSTSDKFLDHGTFLYHTTTEADKEYNGFYEINEKNKSLIQSGNTIEKVTSATKIKDDFVIGRNGEDVGTKGVFKVMFNHETSELTSESYHFGGTTGTEYTFKVEKLIYNNGIPYIRNTTSWKYLIDGIFEKIDVLDTSDKDMVDVSTFNMKTFVVTRKKLFEIEKFTSYRILFKEEYFSKTFSDKIERLVNDNSYARVLTKDSDNLLTEYTCSKKGKEFIFQSINMMIGTTGLLSETISDEPQRYINIIHVDNEAVSGKKFANDESRYIVINNDYDFSGCPDFGIEKTNAITNYEEKYFICTNDQVYQFDKIDTDVSYSQFDNIPTIEFYKILPISDEKYLINSKNGLYIYSTKTKSCFKNNIRENYDIPSLSKYRFSRDESYNYIYGNENGEVYTSKNYRQWTKLLEIPGVKIKDIHIKNQNEYYFGTNDGLYASQYTYTISNNIPQYTIENASQLYNSMFDKLSTIVHDIIDNHVIEDHSTSSFIGYINDEILSTSFTPIQDFYKERKLCSDEDKLSELSVRNDMVYEMYTSNTADGDIMLSVSNFLSTYQAENFSYIMKRYTSGITELFIYVPTTNTYYLPHVDGSSYCIVEKEKLIKRKNLGSFGIDKMNVKSKTEGNYTDLVVSVTSSLYHIDNIMDIEINGNSLPLKIYKDYDYEDSDGDAVKMFHSKIYPSVLREYDVSKTDEQGYYNFRFSCFGSDAQAIRIQFYDSQNHKEDETYKVHFQLNGGTGMFSDQRFNVGQNKNLKKAEGIITNEEKIFNGWSLKQNPEDNTNPDYIDRGLFPGDIDITPYIRNGVVNLYAVWLNYEFSENDTTLAINANTDEFYIESGEINEDTKLGKKAVINYGD